MSAMATTDVEQTGSEPSSGTGGEPISATGGGPSSTPGPASQKSLIGLIVELVAIVAVAVGLAFAVQGFIVKPYRIPTGSMKPTLAEGQRVLVNRLAMDFSEPHVGGIYVFHPPEGAEEEECGPVAHMVKFGGQACSVALPKEASANYIKRIVAGPGDEIYVKEGHVFRKAAGKSQFVREQDSYIKQCADGPECSFLKPIKIAAGHWFMMGDNRGDSDDSRFWGPVPTAWIIGQAVVTYWPPDRIGIF